MGYKLFTYHELDLGWYAVAIKLNGATTAGNINHPFLRRYADTDRENVSRRQARKIHEVKGFQNYVPTMNLKAEK